MIVPYRSRKLRLVGANHHVIDKTNPCNLSPSSVHLPLTSPSPSSTCQEEMGATQSTTNGGEDYTQFESDDSYVVLGIGEDASGAEIKVRSLPFVIAC